MKSKLSALIRSWAVEQESTNFQKLNKIEQNFFFGLPRVFRLFSAIGVGEALPNGNPRN